MGERVLAGSFIVFAVVSFIMAMRIPPPRVDTPLVGSFWPGMALIMLFICSSIEMVRLLREPKEAREARARAEAKKIALLQEATGERSEDRLLLFGFFISLFYIIAIYYMGFTVTTPLFMAVYMYVTGYRKAFMLAVAPVITIVILLLLFVVATYIPLPRGIGIFKEISVLIY